MKTHHHRGRRLTSDSLSSSVFRAPKPRRHRSSWFSRARLHVFSRRSRFSSSSFWFCKELSGRRPQRRPRPPPAPPAPQPHTSSSSSTTCCSSSVIRAFFLSRALWAATRFFSFLRGRAAVRAARPPPPSLPPTRRGGAPSPAQRFLLRAQMSEPLPLAGRLRGLHVRRAGGGSYRQDNGNMAAGRGAGRLGCLARDEEQPGGCGTGQRCHGRRGRSGRRRAARRHDSRPSALVAAPPGFLRSIVALPHWPGWHDGAP